MKPRMKKWLTGLLSAALLAGNLPVYALNSVYADEFSAEEAAADTTQETTATDLAGEESGDFFAGDEETVAEETSSFIETDGFLASEGDFQEEEFISSEEDGWESGTTFTETLPEDLQDQNGYLEHLTLYGSNNSATPLSLTRRQDLDNEFNGKVYVAEYGSNMDSSAFWLTADLSQTAPEGSTISLEAVSLDGQKQSKEMSATAYTDGVRYNLGGSIFSSGANGSKRAFYTITAGTEAEKQTYHILVTRRLDLADIKAFLPEDTDFAQNILPKFDTTGTTRTYEANVAASTSSIHLTAKAYSQNWYHLKVTAATEENPEPSEIFFATENPAVDIPLSASGDTTITFSMEASDTYADTAVTSDYVSQGTYTILIHKQQSSSVTFKVTPEDAVITVYRGDGERIEPSAASLQVYENLLQGEAYTWNVSRYGYVSARGTFTGGEQSEITADLTKQDATQPELTDNDWINFRNSENNNGITDKPTPVSAEETIQKWATRIGVGWEAAITPPLILDGYLYAASGQFIYKLDKNSGEIVAISQQLSGNMQYAMIPLTYAEGMLFAQIGGGQIQAVSASSLKSLWISESLGGQTLSPITYKDGYLYTGTWNSETTAGSYFCLSVTDEDPSRGDEIKYCTWKYNHKGGFYWAGSYASGDYLVFGSDDGAGENDNENSSILYSVNTHTGLLLDKLTGLNGDIRSTVVYNNGYVYFTTKGGYLYRVSMNGDGTFGSVISYNLGGSSTASPVVYNGRIYLGVCGTGGHFNTDGGHHFDVLNETASGISLAYSVSIPGYPQAAPLLSTAYENRDFDGDGKADGKVYLYFTYNAKPGGIYMLEDAPGQTSGKAVELFRPASDQQEYCISTICVDRDGVLYYKNDSNYLMALETNGAYLDNVTITADTGKVTWPSVFRKDTLKYKLTVPEGTQKVSFALAVPAGCTMTVNGQSCDGSYTADTSSGSCDVTVQVTNGKKSREYLFQLAQDLSVPTLANMTVSTSNTYANVANRLAISPEFSSTVTSYRVLYTGTREFLNIFAEPSDSSASVTAQGIRGTSKVTVLGKVTGSGSAHRIAMYFDKNTPEAEAEVRLTITSKTGKKTEYTLIVQRTETPPTPTPEPPVTVTPTPEPPITAVPTPTETPEIFGPWTTLSPATVFAPETQQRTSNKGNTEARTVGSKLTPTLKVNVKSIKLKVKQFTSKVTVTGLANGDSIKSWTSSNKKIVSVNNKGTVKGLKAGKAKISVTLASGKKQAISVTVQKTTVKTEKITGLKSKINLKKGKKLTLKPVLTPITSQESITYTTSNKKIVTVSKKGVIAGKKKGTAKITVKSGSKKYVIKVTVK